MKEYYKTKIHNIYVSIETKEKFLFRFKEIVSQVEMTCFGALNFRWNERSRNIESHR